LINLGNCLIQKSFLKNGRVDENSKKHVSFTADISSSEIDSANASKIKPAFMYTLTWQTTANIITI
jgi:hypothetical protein